MEVVDRGTAPRLLAYLRDAWDAPGLEFADEPERVLGGNATFIHGFSLRGAPGGFDGDLILRVFRADQMTDAVRAEAIIQSGVARLGYAAPRVLAVCTDKDVLGAPFTVMERVPGTTLFTGLAPTRSDAMHVDLGRLLVAFPRALLTMPDAIGAWLARLHALDPRPVVDALEREGIGSELFRIERELDRAVASLDGAPPETRASFAPALDWVRKHVADGDGPGLVICHGDFHVLNMMARDGEITGVIDWTDSLVAPPAFDVAQTRFLLALGPLSLPPLLRPAARRVQRRLASAFLKAYGRRREIDPTLIPRYETIRALRELAGIARERLIAAERLDGEPRPSGNPWDRAGLGPMLVDRVEAVAGVRVELPSRTA